MEKQSFTGATAALKDFVKRKLQNHKVDFNTNLSGVQSVTISEKTTGELFLEIEAQDPEPDFGNYDQIADAAIQAILQYIGEEKKEEQ